MSAAHEKQANPAADPATPFGRELQKSLLYGLLAGGAYGGGSYLLDKMKGIRGAKPKPKPRYGFSLPENFDEAAVEAGYPARGKVAASGDLARLLPLLGAGAGGLIGAVRARPGQKMKGILTGAAGGGLLGAAGTALQSDDVAQRLGRLLPSVSPVKNYPGNDTASYGWARSPDPFHATVRGFVNPALFAAGTLGTAGVIGSMSKADTNRRREDSVAAARQEYFDALMGPDNDEKKKDTATAKAASLDALYDRFAKRAEEESKLTTTLRGLKDMLHMGANTWLSSAGPTAAATATLGGLYMYNKTKNDSARKRFQIAQDAKRRLRPLQTPWIDPEELAAIKGVVEQPSASTPRLYNG